MKKNRVVLITDCKDVAFNEMSWIICQECQQSISAFCVEQRADWRILSKAWYS